MPTYIGENKIIDRYLGDKFLEAVYIGGNKVYDPYTEITGYLPVIYKSRATVALKNYRIYGTSEGAGVETGYRAVEYLKSTGTQIIITDIIGSSANRYELDLKFGSANADSKRGFFGTIETSSGAVVTRLNGNWGSSNNQSLGAYFFETTNASMKDLGSSAYRTNRNTFVMSSTSASYGAVSWTPPAMTLEALSLPLALFGVVEGSSASEFKPFAQSDMWLYSCIVKNANGDKIHDLRPVERVSDGELGLFDTIAGKFYTNAGTGAFEKGNYTETSSNSVPHGYKLPLTVESGAQSQDIPIYIGDSKLGEEEYVDFGEQKVYKYAAPLKVYGWHVDPSISDPAQAITYLGDAVGKTPAAMGTDTFSYGDWSDAFFMPKPCMVKSDGTVDYYLDPNDYTKKADGTASDVANASYDGNAMMEWPLLWWKYEAGETEGEGCFYVANRKPDDTYHCWCNYDADNNITEHFYTAIYNGTGTDKLRSISGVALTSANGNGGTTGTQEVTRATANNTTSKTEWYIDVWADRMLINGLLILMGKSLNSQAVFGRGLDTGLQAAKEAYVTGSLNDKGLFWGVTADGNSGVKVFGMENWWGCVWHRTAGLIGLANGNTAYKMTYGTADGSTANGYNTTGNGYFVDTIARPANGYVKTCKFGEYGYLPLTVGESSTTYYSDYWWTNNTILTFGRTGGFSNATEMSGTSYVYLRYPASDKGWSVSACLSLKPLAKTTLKPNLIPTDPPVPLPPIPTYKGENTLSSTETLGEVMVKGRIGPRQWPLTNLIFHRYDEYFPGLQRADIFAVTEPFYLETGAYILQQTVVTVGTPVVVIQTKEFTGGIFPSSDGYWHVSTPGFYRFQVNKDAKEIYNPYTAAQLEELGKTSTITKI